MILKVIIQWNSENIASNFSRNGGGSDCVIYTLLNVHKLQKLSL